MTFTIRSLRARRKASLASALALAATIGALVVLPAATASAMAIDCSYGGPGLKSYIGSGRDGVTCQGEGTGVGSGVGFHSVTTAGPGQLVPDGYCPAGAIPPVIPDDFYDHGLISTYTHEEVISQTGEPGDVMLPTETVTDYYRLGRLVGTRNIVKDGTGVVRTINFADLTLQGSNGAGVVLSSAGSCSGGWSVNATALTPSPADNPISVPLAAPGSPAPAASAHEVITMGAMTPVPFSSGNFFLRVDLTNIDSVSLSADVDLDLSEFSLVAIAALSHNGSCPFATNFDEHCTVGTLAPGQTQTLTFVVQQKPDASAGATLPITTEFNGYDKIGVGYLNHEVARRSYVAPPAS